MSRYGRRSRARVDSRELRYEWGATTTSGMGMAMSSTFRGVSVLPGVGGNHSDRWTLLIV